MPQGRGKADRHTDKQQGYDMSSFLETRLDKPQALTHYANQVKRLCKKLEGVTIELAQIEVKGQIRFIAGINSSAQWNDAQRALLRSWNVEIVEPHFAGKMSLRTDGGALHAEENMAIYIQSIGGRGLRWSRAVVGACYDTKSGSRSYVCQACRSVIGTVGGMIEPPF